MLEIPDPCLPNPCKNEGVCKADLNTFECRCVPGFKGKTCEGMFHDALLMIEQLGRLPGAKFST